VFKLVLSAAVVGVFAGCGGDGDGVDLGAPSIVACFAVPQTVEFSMTPSNAPSSPNQSIVGPMKYNGQAVIGQTFIYPGGNKRTDYWTVTNKGVTDIASVRSDGTDTLDMVFPSNMIPGQTIDGNVQTATGAYKYYNTLVRFEDVTLADKTFFNACHIKYEDSLGSASEVWYAPGYGLIKTVRFGETSQYNGGL
jgi:hypothetical protein